MMNLLTGSLHRTGQCARSIFRGGRHLALVALLFSAGAITANAQVTTADILGTVTDPTGAVIPNATVTVKNLGTGEVRTTTTSASGDYVVSLLPVGHYSVTVKDAGFKSSTTPDLSVEAGDRARNDVHLETGGSSETVTVEATTPLLQADNATVSSTVTAKAVQDLPLNGRNFVQLVQIVPGANEGPGNGLTSGGRPDDRRVSASFSVNGQDDTLNNYVVDGIDDNERVIGTIGIRPSVEGIEEITVETNSYSAEAGRTAGGVVNIITRSGTNNFHGTAYEFFRNDIFNAFNVLQNTGAKPELRQNQFGGSIGGPIIKDKAFFFFDYEGFRQVVGVTDTSTVPTIDEYDNINSIGGGSPQALVNAGNGTAGMPIDPIALNYLKLFPAPNAGPVGQLTNNYIISPKKTQFSNTYDTRGDYHFSPRDSFFARYDYNHVNTFNPPALGVVNGFEISGGRYNFDGPATDVEQQGALGYTHIFNERLILDTRAAYTRVNNLSLPLNYGLSPDTAVGFGSNMNFNSFSNFLTPIAFGPFSDIGDGAYVPLQDIDSTYQYGGTLSYTIGNHNIKGGVTYIRRQARNVQSAFAAGQYGFGLSTDSCLSAYVAGQCANKATAKQTQDNQLASSLVGAFSSDSRNYDLTPPDYRSYEPSFFLLDSWKATPKLTVLYGFRYDVFTPFTEAHNRISNFDFFGALGASPANVDNYLEVAGVNGVDRNAGIQTDYSNFAPRIGFSYSLRPNTVVRGGYGLSFFPGNYTSNADLKNAPFVSVFSPNCVSQIAYNIITANAASNTLPGGQNCGSAASPGAPATFDAGLPLPAAQTINSNSLSFVAEDPKLRSAIIQQFNFQVEQQLGPNVLTVGYVGNIGQHLPETINNINAPLPYDSVNLANPNNPANPGQFLLSAQGKLTNLSGVGWLQSEGVSKYNALQMSFQRRFVKGLAFDANYTWASALSDNTGFSQEGAQGWSNANAFEINKIEYGNAENEIKNRFALSLNYTLPFGANFTGVKKQLLHGWEFNTISVWQSGKPVSILNGGSGDFTSTGDGAGNVYGNRAVPNNNAGPDRPNTIGNPNSGNRSLHSFFNTAAFAPQPLGTVGNTERNSVFGPQFRHFDASIFKNFPVTERVNVQFRAESYNFSNTPSYIITQGSGNAQLGNPAFGTITNYDPNYNPRTFQFALKASF